MNMHPDQSTIYQIKKAKNNAQAVLREKQLSENLKPAIKLHKKTAPVSTKLLKKKLQLEMQL